MNWSNGIRQSPPCYPNLSFQSWWEKRDVTFAKSNKFIGRVVHVWWLLATRLISATRKLPPFCEICSWSSDPVGDSTHMCSSFLSSTFPFIASAFPSSLTFWRHPTGRENPVWWVRGWYQVYTNVCPCAVRRLLRRWISQSSLRNNLDVTQRSGIWS